jgi:hypothetical protein
MKSDDLILARDWALKKGAFPEFVDQANEVLADRQGE